MPFSLSLLIMVVIGALLCLLVCWYIKQRKEEIYIETHKKEMAKAQLELQENHAHLSEEYNKFLTIHKKEEQKFKPSYIYEKDKHDLNKKIYKKVGKDKTHLVFYTSILPLRKSEWSQGTQYINTVMPGEIIIDRKIPLDDIVYFESTGDVSFTSHNYGGGSSIGGAIIGGLLAGDAGAIIGSRKSVNSMTMSHDTRETVLKLKTGIERLPFKFYDIFCKVIPDKDLKSIQAVSLSNDSNKKLESPKSNLDEIKKLKDLLDIGAITQEEFENKKKELINL